jgi:16S rRNA (uracil1498-N3)-methyltransferase
MFLLFRDLDLQPAARLALESEETRHVRARRLQAGDQVFVGNGRGRRWSGVLQAGLKTLVLGADAPQSFPEPERILLVSPASGKRWDWLIQKATELGVTIIHPLLCAFTERKEVSPDRSRRILLEAAAQSRRFTLPKIVEPLAFSAAVSQVSSGAGESILLDPSGQLPVNQLTFSEASLSIFVGPEGGFHPEELEQARAGNIQIARLGRTILRTETAALAALACTLR